MSDKNPSDSPAELQYGLAKSWRELIGKTETLGYSTFSWRTISSAQAPP